MSSISPQDDFESVIVPLIGDAYRTALRFSRRRDDADDLMQEALLHALRGFRRFQPGTNARAWLRTIVHSVFLTRYRRHRRQPEIGVTYLDRIDGRGSTITYTAVDSHWHVRQAFENLPSAFREAVQLVDLDELTYQEAAAALRCPLNTVKSRVRRGRRHLANEIRAMTPR